jgi:diguanylate cyclase (GGDEF)-like protein
LGLSIWAGGVALDAWEDLVAHAAGNVTLLSDLLYFFYGVPILFVSSTSGADQRSRLFLWLYGLQAIVIAYLAYIVLFSGAPFTGEPSAPISATRLALAFLIENSFLALAATAQLVSCSGSEERRFYRTLVAFLWLYLVLSTAYNYLFPNVDLNIPGLNDCLIDLPFLAFALLLAASPRYAGRSDELSNKSPVALFVASASPIFFTVGMLALGTVVMHRHFTIGATVIAFALACYGLQATVLQSRYIRSQEALRKALGRLENLSLTDALTGVANRRCFDQTLEREWNRAKRAGEQLSLLMIDLDYFKNLNDRYGHVYGDECLVTVARALSAALPREADTLARYGGEEFCAILPDTDRAGAQTVADKMRSAVRRLGIRNETAIGTTATISIGITTFEPAGDASCLDLVRGSDRALYRAKSDGRDRVEFFAA